MVGHFCFRFDYAWQAAAATGTLAVRQDGNASQGANTNSEAASSAITKEMVEKQMEQRNAKKTPKQVKDFGSKTPEQEKSTFQTASDSYKTGKKSLGSLAEDPPRQDYTIIAVPVLPLVTIYQAGDDGLTAQEADALNQMLAAEMETIALARATRISLDRYSGAAEAHDLTWMAQQNAAYLYYKQQLGTSLLINATKIDNWLAIYPADRETAPSIDTIVQMQTRLATTGFTPAEIVAHKRFGLTDEELEWIRQQTVNANPADLAVTLREDLAETAVDFRELGNLLANPEPTFSQQIPGASLAQASGTAENLASVGPVEESMEVGNPTANAANVELRVRRLGMPTNWNVTLTPSSVTGLAPGTHRTVKVLISPSSAAPQGSTARVAVEGFIGGVLIGGVDFQVEVPTYARFAVARIALPFAARN